MRRLCGFCSSFENWGVVVVVECGVEWKKERVNGHEKNEMKLSLKY